jgi:MFS family permease
MGMFTPPNNSSIMGAAPHEKLGVAGGLLNMMRSLGLIFGVDISGLIFTSIEHRRLAAAGYAHFGSGVPVAVRDHAFMAGFVVVLVVLLGLNLVAAALSAARKESGSVAIKSEAANRFVGE